MTASRAVVVMATRVVGRVVVMVTRVVDLVTASRAVAVMVTVVVTASRAVAVMVTAVVMVTRAVAVMVTAVVMVSRVVVRVVVMVTGGAMASSGAGRATAMTAEVVLEDCAVMGVKHRRKRVPKAGVGWPVEGQRGSMKTNPCMNLN